MDIKDNIKTICKAKGRTFAQLANDLNITRQTLFRQLTGNTTTDTLKRIADRLNVAPFILLHPDPAQAMKEEETGHTPGPDASNPQPRPGRSYTAPAVLSCPICGAPLEITIQTTGARCPSSHDEKPGAQDEPGPEILTDQDRTSDGQTNRPTDEQGPEEIKLFED